MQLLEPELIEVARSTGDLLAEQNITTDVMRTLNPYYPTDEMWQAGKNSPVSPAQQVQAVERLLALVKDAHGVEASDALRRRLDFRADCYPEGDCSVNGLEHDLWLRFADLVLIRALEVQQRRRSSPNGDPFVDYAPASEIAGEYGKDPSTVKQACENGWIPARKRGREWWIKREDAQKRWRKSETPAP